MLDSHVARKSNARCDNVVTMAPDRRSTLADDEAALRSCAVRLVEAIEAVLGEWIRGSIALRSPSHATSPAADRAVSDGTASLTGELRELLGSDIDDQRASPLQVLRHGVRFATEVLADAGVPRVDRDQFALRAFPDDVYGLAPASFADVHQSLHEPGLVWGAAKAHIHMRRHSEPGPVPPTPEPDRGSG